MKRFLLLVLLFDLARVNGYTDEMMLGATKGTLQIQSRPVTEKAWRRDVVMTDGEGRIKGDGGVVGEKASTDAIDYTAEHAGEISDAAATTLKADIDRLNATTNMMAKHRVGVAISTAPENERVGPTMYLITTEVSADGKTDTQYVYISCALNRKPVRWVVYEDHGERQAVRAKWVDWTAEGETFTFRGKTWQGVHRCTVERPSFAVGESCLDLPNETWGGDGGMNFGDLVVTVNSTPAYTGYVTNGITGEVIYFDNGFHKPLPSGKEEK